jgi:predicted metalloprotease
MRWKGREQSKNVEDQRGKGGRVAVGGGLSLLILVGVAMCMGGDPLKVLEQAGPITTESSQPYEPSPEQQELAEFTAVVLKDTEDVWHKLFVEHFGTEYREPILRLFSGSVQSACGMASAAVGPFYCPADDRVYIDLQFYELMKQKFGADGDFAQAYVIAHEVGHHVQNLLGINSEVQAMQRQVSKTEANELSVRLELQADCMAGVWGYHTQRARNMLEAGDLEEALNAASAIGDDRIQRESSGRVVPDSFTHGSSAQRVKWFRVGFESGDVAACDTFRVANP